MPRISLNPNTMFLMATILLSTIGVHTIVFHHEHPKFMGDKFEAAMHSEDKKRLAVIVVIVIFAASSLVWALFNRLSDSSQYFLGQTYLDARSLKIHISLINEFRLGILHSKIH